MLNSVAKLAMFAMVIFMISRRKSDVDVCKLTIMRIESFC